MKFHQSLEAKEKRYLQIILFGSPTGFFVSFTMFDSTFRFESVQNKHFWRNAISRSGHFVLASKKEISRVSPHLKRIMNICSVLSVFIAKISFAHFSSNSSIACWQPIRLVYGSHVLCL